MRLNLIAVLVEDHRGTAEHRCPLASEAAEIALLRGASSSRQMYCTIICSGSDLLSRVSFVGAHNLGDNEIGVRRN